jgi:hypothetical protein
MQKSFRSKQSNEKGLCVLILNVQFNLSPDKIPLLPHFYETAPRKMVEMSRYESKGIVASRYGSRRVEMGRNLQRLKPQTKKATQKTQ